MKFKIEIELGNDAMQSYDDIRSAIDKSLILYHGAGKNVPFVGEHVTIRDVYGNRIGKWEVVVSN